MMQSLPPRSPAWLMFRPPAHLGYLQVLQMDTPVSPKLHCCMPLETWWRAVMQKPWHSLWVFQLPWQLPSLMTLLWPRTRPGSQAKRLLLILPCLPSSALQLQWHPLLKACHQQMRTLRLLAAPLLRTTTALGLSPKMPTSVPLFMLTALQKLVWLQQMCQVLRMGCLQRGCLQRGAAVGMG